MDNLWAHLLPVLAAMIAAVPGAIALILQTKRYLKEPVVLDSDASNKYMEAAKGEAAYALTLQQRVMEANTKNTALDCDMKILQLENQSLRLDIISLQQQVEDLQKKVVDLTTELAKYKGEQHDC